MEQLTISVPDFTLKKLKDYASTHHTTVAELIQGFIIRGLKDHLSEESLDESVNLEMFKTLEWIVNDRINNLDQRINGEIASIIDAIEEKIDNKINAVHTRIDRLQQNQSLTENS